MRRYNEVTEWAMKVGTVVDSKLLQSRLPSHVMWGYHLMPDLTIVSKTGRVKKAQKEGISSNFSFSRDGERKSISLPRIIINTIFGGDSTLRCMVIDGNQKNVIGNLVVFNPLEIRNVMDIYTYPGYGVCHNGDVYSLGARVGMSPSLMCSRMSPVTCEDGYQRVSIRTGGAVKKLLVHRIVCKCWRKREDGNGMIVHHADGNRGNNHVNNLRYMTLSENSLHRHGSWETSAISLPEKMCDDRRVPDGFSKYSVDKHGNVYSSHSGKRLSQALRRGYPSVNMTDDSGKRRRLYVHRMVAKIFVDNPHNNPVVNHMDHNKLNRSSENLEWVTHSENSRKYHIYKKKQL